MSKQTLNLEKIQELKDLDGDGEVLKELIQLFLPGTEKKLVKIQAFLDEKSFISIKGIAHEMRSSCANLGAEVLSDFSTQLEYLPQDDEYSANATALLNALSEEFKTVKKKLEAYL